jgi:hypothetical protein
MSTVPDCLGQADPFHWQLNHGARRIIKILVDLLHNSYALVLGPPVASEDPPSCPAQLQQEGERPAACLLCPAEPRRHFHTFLHPPSWGASRLFLDPVPRSMFASFGLAVSDLVLSLFSTGQRQQEYARPTQPENGRCYSRIQSLILSEPFLHASVPPDQLLQVRAVQSSVMVSYQKVCTAHKLAPNEEPNQALLAAQASLRLVTSYAQARLRLSSGLLTYSSG